MYYGKQCDNFCCKNNSHRSFSFRAKDKLPRNKSLSGFTLIELLIVVAIIGILAAIAIPNFLNAQVRAKVSRVQAEMATLATGLELYRTDNNDYPPGPNASAPPPPDTVDTWRVTTPISYIAEVPLDIFYKPMMPSMKGPFDMFGPYIHYYYEPLHSGGRQLTELWVLFSYGPDQDTLDYTPPPESRPIFYDPTNGTVSNGDIYRVGSKP